MNRPKISSLLFAAMLASSVAPLASAASQADQQAADHGSAAHHQKGAAMRAERLDALFNSWHLDDTRRDAFAQTQQDYQAQRQALRKEHEQQLGKIFDPQQLDALHAMRHSALGKHRARPGKLANALFASWDLNDDQRAELASARTSFVSEAKALHDQHFESRDARREAWKALRDKHRQALGKVLSDAQLAVIDQLMQPRHRHHATPKG